MADHFQGFPGNVLISSTCPSFPRLAIFVSTFLYSCQCDLFSFRPSADCSPHIPAGFASSPATCMTGSRCCALVPYITHHLRTRRYLQSFPGIISASSPKENEDNSSCTFPPLRPVTNGKVMLPRHINILVQWSILVASMGKQPNVSEAGWTFCIEYSAARPDKKHSDCTRCSNFSMHLG